MKIIMIPNAPVMSGRHYCIARKLAEQGHEVHYLWWALPYNIKPRELLKHLLTSLHSRTYTHEAFTVHTARRLPYFWPYINGWIFKSQIRKLFRKLDADIIISESYTNETEVPADLPFIYDLADDYAAPGDLYGGTIYKLAFRLLGVKNTMTRQCQNALAVTTVSKILTDFATPLNDHVVRIPNGVERDLILSAKKAGGHKKPNPHSLVYATGFGPWSQGTNTLKAVVELRKEFPDIEITLIGSGVELPAMQEYAAQQKAESYMHFLGYVYDRKKLFELINQNAIGLNISDKNKWRDASHPMKVMDYSALGKKVVSTNLAEVEALGYPNIFLFSSDGVESIVTVMRRAFETPAPAGGYEAISKRVLKEYDWDVLTKQLTDLSKECLKRRAA